MEKIPKRIKDKLKPLVQKLLTKCSGVQALTKKAEWEEMTDIMELLESVRNIEKDHQVPLPNRKNNWERFYEWCAENGAEFSAIRVEEIKDGNFGTVAKRDIKKDEAILTVPRKIMMSESTAKKSKLGPLIEKDSILQHMPSVQVSMHLLAEFLNPKSFWGPYISILPSSYSTILYFSLEEVKTLQKSPVVDEALKILRSIIRQYCYFSQLFEHDSYAKSLGIGPYFTFDLYRWAVSSTMTRQNIVPSAGGEQLIISLVPLFDMCNHINGTLSTDFNLEKDSLVSYSFKPYSEGNEVYMFYGARPNAEFVVHNGFISPENEHDSLEIKLGISRNDPLHSMKKDLCNKLTVSVNGPFHLHRQKPLDEELLKFLEINVMKADELEQFLNDEEESDLGFDDLRKRAFAFLRDRVNLLLRSYGTTVEEDEKLLKESVPETSCMYLAIQLRICEKRILSQTYKYCEQKLCHTV